MPQLVPSSVATELTRGLFLLRVARLLHSCARSPRAFRSSPRSSGGGGSGFWERNGGGVVRCGASRVGQQEAGGGRGGGRVREGVRVSGSNTIRRDEGGGVVLFERGLARLDGTSCVRSVARDRAGIQRSYRESIVCCFPARTSVESALGGKASHEL